MRPSQDGWCRLLVFQSQWGSLRNTKRGLRKVAATKKEEGTGARWTQCPLFFLLHAAVLLFQSQSEQGTIKEGGGSLVTCLPLLLLWRVGSDTTSHHPMVQKMLLRCCFTISQLSDFLHWTVSKQMLTDAASPVCIAVLFTTKVEAPNFSSPDSHKPFKLNKCGGQNPYQHTHCHCHYFSAGASPKPKLSWAAEKSFWRNKLKQVRWDREWRNEASSIDLPPSACEVDLCTLIMYRIDILYVLQTWLFLE